MPPATAAAHGIILVPAVRRVARPGGPVPRSARSEANDPRLRITVVTVAVGFAAVLAALLAPWGARMIDLEVYRAASRAVVHGVDPYSVSGPDGLPFTYPVFAALVFVPFALVPTMAARVAITVMSFAGWRPESS
jgi:hypothetical protein